MSANPSIASLNSVGQSIWCDSLSREFLDSGELKKLVDLGVSGLTSNPTIFNAAISGSALYDKDLKDLAGKGLSIQLIAEELMISDVGRAADLLRSTYDRTAGRDGYASIEVSPLLAYDTKGTVEEAKRIWGKLNRPNVMIKVPATSEGLPAIEELLSAGINVNITLIFSVSVHRSVMQAYLSALSKRAAAGQAVSQIASVASFFVSRVDAIAEKAMDSLISEEKLSLSQKEKVLGKIGIANSKLAYDAFKQIFSGADFANLAAKEAMVQRPLWASTGVKNPSFSPLLYVETLAGKDTVNTLPPQTLKALLAAGKFNAQIETDLDGAKAALQALKSYGVNFEELLVQLQKQGVELFADSYRSLLASVEEKAKRLS